MHVLVFVWALSVAICAFCMENKEQVALQARTLLLDDTTYFVGALGTVKDDATALVAYEYFAPCFDSQNEKSSSNPGDLLFLALPASEQWRLTLRPNTTATLAIASSPDMNTVDVRHGHMSPAGRLHWPENRPEWRRGMASKGRMTMYGHMHLVTHSESIDTLGNCFVAHHPDAAAWVPGSPTSPHIAKWVRFSPAKIHYVGGFGDEHFIGSVDMDLYRSVKPALDEHRAPGLYMQTN